jgi:hypothetical protein
VHFGYPGRTQSYIEAATSDFLFLTGQNPVQDKNGKWIEREGDVAISLFVPEENADAINREVQSEMENIRRIFAKKEGNNIG